MFDIIGILGFTLAIGIGILDALGEIPKKKVSPNLIIYAKM